MEKNAKWVAVYEMKDGSEERFPMYSNEDLQHERAEANREVHDPKSYVKGYRVEYPTSHTVVERG